MADRFFDVDRYLERLEGVEKNGTGWRAFCPCHDDVGSSQKGLSITVEGDKLLMKCHSPQCAVTLPDVHETLFGSNGDLPLRVNVKATRGRVVSKHPFTEADGTVLYYEVRLDPKGFRLEQPDGTQNVDSVPRVLYNLPAVIEALERGDEIHLTCGTKDADALTTEGLVATTNAGGEGTWDDAYTETLRGANVVLHIDRDKAGFERGRRLQQELSGVAALLRIVEADRGKDAHDHLALGGTVDDLRDVHYLPTTFATAHDAPPTTISENAFHGIAGEFVSIIEPHSEADPVALLTQFLGCAGNAIGHTAGFEVESTFHGTNTYVLLVGDTSKGRKGTSLNHALRVVKDADVSWSDCIVTGLSSGEGLIERVKDGEVAVEGEPGHLKVEFGREGAPDKRCMVIEPEFATVLANTKRQGNTLSPILRSAWDGVRLQILTKNSPAIASDAHISVIAHVTTDELRRHLDSTEATNGFANRFLIAYVRRSKSLPHGGRVEDDDLRGVVSRVREVVSYVGSRRVLLRDAKANALWEQEYERLSEGGYGLLGAVTSRAEAQVMRLACIYAVLDKASKIRAEHLSAALAVWDYCEASCRHIFGDSTGNADADTILSALRSDYRGKTRSEISTLFGRNRAKRDIDLALALLEQQGRVALYREKGEGRGRPTERWVVT